MNIILAETIFFAFIFGVLSTVLGYLFLKFDRKIEILILIFFIGFVAGLSLLLLQY